MEEEKIIQNMEFIENKEFSINTPKLSSSKPIDLNVIEKEEGNSAESNLEDEESLRYDTIYKPVLVDSHNIKTKEQINQNFCRKSSTISTAVSLSENGFDTLTPKKSSINLNEANKSPSQMFFGRNRFYSSPISDYFEGTGDYLKGLYPQKNNYQKSHNYLRKEKVLRDHYSSFDFENLNMEEPKNLDKTSLKLSFDIDLTNPNPLNLPIIPKTSFTNLSYHYNLNQNSGKFDNFPIGCYGYYSVDCKSKNINNYNIILLINSA